MRTRELALCVILSCAAGTGILPLAAQDEIQWLDNYQVARREAQRTQKPLLVEFRCER